MVEVCGRMEVQCSELFGIWADKPGIQGGSLRVYGLGLVV